MKRAFAVAAIFVGAAAAVGAGAFATSPYVGSDDFYDVTNQAILNAQLGNNFASGTAPPQWNAQASPFGDYLGGGGILGDAAMLANRQGTAPMSRFMTSDICSASDLTHASGIVIGISPGGGAGAGSLVWGPNAIFNANPLCNGGPGTPACAPDAGAGLAYDNHGNGPDPLPILDWRDVLALLYGGLDRTTGITDCSSTKRAQLISTWADLFENSACTNGSITHAWRPDDFSELADVFANLIGIEANWKDPAGHTFNGLPVNGVAINGFGTSPFCNAMNWDQTEVKQGACGVGTGTGDNHYIGPGGVPAPDGLHHLPPPGTYGSVTAGNQPFVFPTSFQDNDPIRTFCLSNGSLGRLGEDVCNNDSKLGVVLPISALTFVPNQSPGLLPYPANVQCTGGTTSGPAPKVFKCAPRIHGTFFGVGQCPNGDTPFAFGCLIPVGPGASGPTSQCTAIRSEFPTLCNVGPCSSEARIYNEQVYDGTAAAGSVGTLTFNVPEPTFVQALPQTGAYARIHMRTVSTVSTKTCQLATSADQIGCLIQADVHSIGVAGSGAGTWEERDPVHGVGAPGSTVPIRVNGLLAGAGCTPAAPGQGPSYPLWSKIYLSSIVGFGNVSQAEQTLAEFMSFDQNLTAIGLAPLPLNGANHVDISTGNPNPFCEDFNEATICGAAVNTNGCSSNVTSTGGLLQNATIGSFTSAPPAPITTPGCPAPMPGVPGCTVPIASTICGNGIVEPYEECDPPSATCSLTCRLQ